MPRSVLQSIRRKDDFKKKYDVMVEVTYDGVDRSREDCMAEGDDWFYSMNYSIYRQDNAFDSDQ
jgi:hypothetical protein